MTSGRWGERRGWRAYLFVPPARIHKAADPALRSNGPLICDLEDAVPADGKDEARRRVGALLRAGPSVYVRVNGEDTPWFEADLEILNSPHLLGVLLPKVVSGASIDRLANAIGPHASVIPLVETAAGLESIAELVLNPAVERVAFGALDFRRDMRMSGGHVELLYARSRIGVASRAGGLLQPLDSVDPDLSAGPRYVAHCRRARRLGFGGKMCVHPAQMGAVNRAFSPSPDRVAWARRVLSGNVDEPHRLDGEMVDAPITAEARDVIDESGWRRSPTS